MEDIKKVSDEIRDILSERRNELNLSFEEEGHEYTMMDIDGQLRKDFPSVSKVMKLFYDEFPTEEAARNKAKGDPYVMQTLLAEWEEMGKISTNMGSRVHYELEIETLKRCGLNKEVRQPIYECDMEMIMKGDRMIRAGYNFLKLMGDRGAVLIDTEIVLGDPELGYVGQGDTCWLITNKSKTGYGFIITDYKTNKKKNMETNGYTKPMREPFKNLPNNALGHYNTQLPLYGKLLLKMLKGTKYENLPLLGCIIVHLTDEQEFIEHRVPREVVDTIMKMDIKPKLTTLKK
jgi:hypothetical protein